MENEARTALGLELRAEAAAWLAELTAIALPDGTQAARELFQALGELEAEVADAAADEVELTRLQAWLTAGFFAAPDPYAPADVVVVEVTNEARRRELASSGAASASSATGATSASTEARGASATGANEFAAGKAQSPPARTAAAAPLPRTGAVAAPPAPADARQVDDRRGGWPGASADPHAARSDAPRQAAADRRSAEGPPSGIRGLAALAALAGSGGVEIPLDAHHPPHTVDQPHDGSDRAAVDLEIDAYPTPPYPVDADRADPSPARRPATDVRPSTSADSSVEAGRVREVDRDAVQLPPRIIRIPFTPQAVERADDTDEGWTAGPPLPIPFLAPGEDDQDAAPGGSAAGPTSDARPAVAIPTMRVFDGRAAPVPAPDARRPAEWAGFEAAAESTGSFLARAARAAGRRLRPAAEIVGGAEVSAAALTPAPAEPAARQIIPTPPADSDAYATVLAREVVPAPRPVEAVDWPAPDVTDLLDALASEIAHEYRRYYGE